MGLLPRHCCEWMPLQRGYAIAAHIHLLYTMEEFYHTARGMHIKIRSHVRYESMPRRLPKEVFKHPIWAV